MDAMIDSTFVPLLLKSIGFLALAFLLWPIARRHSAALQSVYWRGVMCGLLVLGIFSLWLPFLKIEIGAPNANASPIELAAQSEGGWRILSSTASLSNQIVGETTTLASNPSLTGFNLLLTVWTIGSVVLGSMFLFARWRLSRPRSGNVACREMLIECQSALGMNESVRLECADHIAMPCAWGIVRPTVMLPKSAETWDKERQRMVLMHELAHLRRRDPLFDFIGRLGMVFFWINPLSWLAFKQLRLAAERATDDAVMAGGVAANSYARLLLQFAKDGLAGRRLVMATATSMAQQSTVGLRVEKILDGTQTRSVPRRMRTVALLGAAAICAAAIGGLQSTRAQEDQPPPKPELQKLDNAKAGIEYIRDKMRAIIIPEVSFDEATLEEAVAFLRQAALANDADNEGINIIIKAPRHRDKNNPRPLNLQLHDVPLEDALKFTTELAGYRYHIDPLAVVIIPRFVETGQLITNNFRVPVGFLASNGERFNTGQAVLEAAGIPFPEGASTAYIADKSELLVRNTMTNMELVQVYVDSIIQVDKNRRQVSMRAEIYRLPRGQALGFLEQYEKSEDAADAITVLRKLVADGKAELVSSPYLSTTSGESATIGSGTAYDYTANYAEADGKDIAIAGSCFVGTTITFAPNIETDGITLTADMKVEKTFGAPTIEKATVVAPVSGKRMPVERVRIDRATIETSTKLFSGRAKFLGSLSPSEEGNGEMLLVFLKVWVPGLE